MTGFRLPVTAFKKLNVCLGVWEKFPSYKLCLSWRRCVYSSHQSNIINCRKHFGIFPVKYDVFLRPHSQCISVLCVRLKSDKRSRKKKQTLQEEEEEEEEEDEEDEERSNSEDDEFENDPSIVKDYKDLDKVVQSFRYDVIMKAGLDIARKKQLLWFTMHCKYNPIKQTLYFSKVEDAFYNGELRLNGEKLWKKSRTVKVGDTLDLIVGEDKETETAVVMRVVFKKASEKTESEKYKVVLRRWKNLKVPKQDVFK